MMWKYFVRLLIFVMVKIHLLAAHQTEEQVKKRLHDLFTPEPFSMEDFKKPLPFDDPNICHMPNFECLSMKGKSEESVCGFIKYTGLFNFDNVCQIHIVNCLVQPKGTNFTYAVPTEYDVIYYNGIELDCTPYLRKTSSLKEAIKLYVSYKFPTQIQFPTEMEEVKNELDDVPDTVIDPF